MGMTNDIFRDPGIDARVDNMSYLVACLPTLCLHLVSLVLYLEE